MFYVKLLFLIRSFSLSFLVHDLGRVKRIWYLLPMRAAKVQASLHIHAVSPEPSLLAHTSSEPRGTFRQKARSLAPLNGWACAVKICHDRMLEDTNSLDAAHLFMFSALMKSNPTPENIIIEEDGVPKFYLGKVYSCSYCQKSFAGKTPLSRHELIHTGEKPYACNFCEKSFSQKVQLEQHVRIHTGEKPFSCTVCDKKFSRRGECNRHIKIKHGVRSSVKWWHTFKKRADIVEKINLGLILDSFN